MSQLYKRFLDGEEPFAPPKNIEYLKRFKKLEDLEKLHIENYYTFEGYYELLQELDIFRPDAKTVKLIDESSDEFSDSVNNDSPDTDN